MAKASYYLGAPEGNGSVILAELIAEFDLNNIKASANLQQCEDGRVGKAADDTKCQWELAGPVAGRLVVVA